MAFRFPKTGFSLALATWFALTACGTKKHESVEPELSKPADTSSDDERTAINQTVAEIEGLVAEAGKPRQFKRVPIIVTRDDDNSVTDHPGACVKLNGRAQYILVKRAVLRQETVLARDGVESTLFRVLLHEIGHCYYHREHDDARIAQAGDSIELAIRRGGAEESKEETREYPMLDASVMASDTLFLPVALKRYYVAELLGQARAHVLEDLAPWAPVRWLSRKRNGAGEGTR